MDARTEHLVALVKDGARLERFKARLGAGGLSRSTISAYLVGSSIFVRWLAGEYVPRGRRSVGPTDVAPEVPS